jgi:major vault protein
MSEKFQPYIIKIPPFHYLHVLNNNTNVSRLETGPQKFVIFDNDSVVLGPKKMIVIPPRHYCIVENPAIRNEKNEVLLDQHGQVRLRHG